MVLPNVSFDRKMGQGNRQSTKYKEFVIAAEPQGL